MNDAIMSAHLHSEVLKLTDDVTRAVCSNESSERILERVKALSDSLRSTKDVDTTTTIQPCQSFFVALVSLFKLLDRVTLSLSANLVPAYREVVEIVICLVHRLVSHDQDWKTASTTWAKAYRHGRKTTQEVMRRFLSYVQKSVPYILLGLDASVCCSSVACARSIVHLVRHLAPLFILWSSKSVPLALETLVHILQTLHRLLLHISTKEPFFSDTMSPFMRVLGVTEDQLPLIREAQANLERDPHLYTETFQCISSWIELFFFLSEKYPAAADCMRATCPGLITMISHDAKSGTLVDLGKTETMAAAVQCMARLTAAYTQHRVRKAGSSSENLIQHLCSNKREANGADQGIENLVLCLSTFFETVIDFLHEFPTEFGCLSPGLTQLLTTTVTDLIATDFGPHIKLALRVMDLIGLYRGAEHQLDPPNFVSRYACLVNALPSALTLDLFSQCIDQGRLRLTSGATEADFNFFLSKIATSLALCSCLVYGQNVPLGLVLAELQKLYTYNWRHGLPFFTPVRRLTTTLPLFVESTLSRELATSSPATKGLDAWTHLELFVNWIGGAHSNLKFLRFCYPAFARYFSPLDLWTVFSDKLRDSGIQNDQTPDIDSTAFDALLDHTLSLQTLEFCFVASLSETLTPQAASPKETLADLLPLLSGLLESQLSELSSRREGQALMSQENPKVYLRDAFLLRSIAIKYWFLRTLLESADWTVSPTQQTRIWKLLASSKGHLLTLLMLKVSPCPLVSECADLLLSYVISLFVTAHDRLQFPFSLSPTSHSNPLDELTMTALDSITLDLTVARQLNPQSYLFWDHASAVLLSELLFVASPFLILRSEDTVDALTFRVRRCSAIFKSYGTPRPHQLSVMSTSIQAFLAALVTIALRLSLLSSVQEGLPEQAEQNKNWSAPSLSGSLGCQQSASPGFPSTPNITISQQLIEECQTSSSSELVSRNAPPTKNSVSHICMAQKIIETCQQCLTLPQKDVRLTALQGILYGLESLTDCRGVLNPVIHQMWPFFVTKFVDIYEYAISALKALILQWIFKHAMPFVQLRFETHLLPQMTVLLETWDPASDQLSHDQKPLFRLQCTLLDVLIDYLASEQPAKPAVATCLGLGIRFMDENAADLVYAKAWRLVLGCFHAQFEASFAGLLALAFLMLELIPDLDWRTNQSAPPSPGSRIKDLTRFHFPSMSMETYVRWLANSQSLTRSWSLDLLTENACLKSTWLLEQRKSYVKSNPVSLMTLHSESAHRAQSQTPLIQEIEAPTEPASSSFQASSPLQPSPEYTHLKSHILCCQQLLLMLHQPGEAGIQGSSKNGMPTGSHVVTDNS